MLYPLAGAAHLVGVTGAPGSGKCTLVAALVGEARKGGPTGGGDRDRPVEPDHRWRDPGRPRAHADPRRRLATCSSVRWRRAATRAAWRPARSPRPQSMDAAGFPLIFIETVGTGQSEVEVAAIADTTMVVQSPGDGRRGPGDQGRSARGGRPRRRQQVRPPGRRPRRLPAASDAHRRRAARPRDGRSAAPQAARRAARLGADRAGVPELLARSIAATPRDARTETGETDAAALKRAEAQLSGILAQRIGDQLRAPGAVRATQRDAARGRLPPARPVLGGRPAAGPARRLRGG